MSGKLQDYQVLDVLCGGTFYKVRHKVTNDIFAWKAYDCTAYSNEQLRGVALDADAINKACGGAAALLRVHDTVLHAPSRTLYFVLEHGAWRSLAELIDSCDSADKCASEAFVWHLLLELARACRALQNVKLSVLRVCLSPATVVVEEGGAVRLHCCEPAATPGAPTTPVLRQLGDLLSALCAAPRADKHSQYSDDLLHIIGFLTDERNSNLHPDVILYHPTVLANIETFSRPKHLSEILVSVDYSHSTSVNKCDSEKAVELSRAVQPAPRSSKTQESPIYCNITPKKYCNKEIFESNSPQGQLSPTIAALALELPGFVPRSRKAITGALDTYTAAQQVTENTLSQQWMSRLIALRQREHSLNQRERDLIAKEILNSPAAKIIPLNDSEVPDISESNGITLPPMVTQAEDRQWVSRRHRRTSSARLKNRRKTFAYEDLDSSLSADNGDGSMVITATKFTKDNMPRNLFPEPAKKVHFTPVNPFAESDESVTLTFYELENVDKEGYQLPRQQEQVVKDISKFKYLDLEKMTSEKRAAMPWSHSSPSKQAKMSQTIFSDITNTKGNLRKTPSKSSITSKGSSISRFSIASCKSQWSMDSSSKASDGSIADRTRASIRQSLAQTPIAPDAKKKSRKSLLPFKTPFKFINSTKI
ncbi:uncharacterized protein LOC134670583 [Cydia fagiglandana]|uniref:uncharacterized protein LOC134670583 n=1 Tax=Cydia fagiglandana TaxID=1458189 RepID=UPI002FEDE571